VFLPSCNRGDLLSLSLLVRLVESLLREDCPGRIWQDGNDVEIGNSGKIEKRVVKL
jgi:hypothetical protein